MTNPIAECVELAGSHVAGVVLYRLRFWMPKAKIMRNGKAWVVFSRERWLKEAMCSKGQFDRAIRALKDRDLIESEIHLFSNAPHAFIRLRPDPSVSTNTAADVGLVDGTDVGLDNGADNNKGDKKRDKKKSSCTGSRAKLKIKLPKGFSEGGDHVKVDDTVFPVGKKKIPTKPNTTKDLVFQYKQCMAEEYDHVMVSVTQKQVGQLSQFLKKCPPGKGSEIFAKVLEDWAEFTSEVAFSAGVKTTPGDPSIGFILVHVNVAIAFATPKPEYKPEPPQAIVSTPPPKTHPKKPVPYDPPIKDMAELLAPPKMKHGKSEPPANAPTPKKLCLISKVGKKSS